MSAEVQPIRQGLSLRGIPSSAREPVIGFALIILAWELIARFFIEFPVLLPSPTVVWGALTENWGLYLRETGYTMFEVLFGFVAGFLLGFLSAVGIFYSPLLRRFLYPVLLGARIVPKAAFVPLFVIWFGIGVSSKVALASFGIFFLVLVQTLLGFRGLGPELVELGRSLHMSERLMFVKMRLPAALPAMMVGVKLSITYALTLVVVAEMAIASHGVGWVIIEARARFQTAEMLAGIVMVAVAGLFLYELGGWIERRTTFWNVDERS